jgi:hypothetical protein
MPRRTIRTPENAELICSRIGDGFTLAQIGREIDCTPGMITDWVREDARFAVIYAHARELQADHFAVEIIEISDDGSNDWMERELASGAIVTVPDHEHVNRSRLRVDVRKWLMAKMAPKRYGEKMQVDVRHEADPAALEYDRLMALAQGRLLAPTIEHEPSQDGRGDG